MSPICSKAAMRALISVLLASSVANAAALPHEVLDARAPAAIQNANAEIAAEAIQAAASAVAEDPENFFEEVSDGLNNRTGWEVFRDFFTRLFGPRNGDDDEDADSTVTVTVAGGATETLTVTAEASAGASISFDIILPPGPTVTASAIITESPATTFTPATEDVFSILPIGDLTTSINATALTHIFLTAPASDIPVITASAIEVPPFPIENGTTIDVLLPTAVPITNEFSVLIPLVTDVPTPATTNVTEPVETMVGPGMNTTLPSGTGIPVVVNLTIPVETVVGPIETGLPVVNVTLPEGTGVVSAPPTPANSSAPAGTGLTFLVPIANATELPANTTVVVVTETVVPVPVTVTGIDATASAGTGLPIVVVGTPLWPNSTYDEPTGSALPAGTGLPLGTGTAVLPVETALPLNTTVTVPLGTGIPLLTGVPVVSVGTGLPIPISESPIYPNTTTATSTSTLVIPIPILVTGVPESATVNLTFPPTPVSETFDPLAALTELPLTVTGSPGTVLNINVTIPVAPFANATAPVVVDATAVAPLETVATASVGTGLPIATPAVETAAPFANTTVAAPTIVVETPAIVILPAPVETTEDNLDSLDSLRIICQDPKIHTLTLPLISRFYGPAAYPALHPFPGCTSPNARQAIQAPGLLNCSVLGSVVQECQAAGKKVLLSVKGSGAGEVGGQADFGDPNVPQDPFGMAFAIGRLGDTDTDKREAEGAEYPREKREEGEDADRPGNQVLPLFDVVGKPPYPLLKNGSETFPPNEGRPGRPVPLELLLGPQSTATPDPNTVPIPVDSEDIENLIDAALNASRTPCPKGYPSRCNTPNPQFPNLFDEYHPPSAFALTLFSLFGEGHTERADLRPLGPDAPSGASPQKLNGTDWINPILTALQRPLGEEVVVDGFDVQVPKEWEGKYQDRKFKELVRRLKELHQEAWEESGGVVGGPADLGADGKGVVYEGWIGGSLKVRSVGLEVRAEVKRVGWYEWDPLKLSE